MTRGGPGITTETLDMYAFSQGFIESGRISYASSMAVLMMIATTAAFTILWRRGAAVARGLSRLAARAIIAMVAASVIVPILWTLLSGFIEPRRHCDADAHAVFTPTLDNFLYVLERDSVRAGLINSILISGCSVLIGAAFGLPLAYAVARYPMRFANDIQFFVLSLRFLPPVAIAIPLIVIWLDVGLYDTRLALIVTYSLLTLATTIWLAIPAFTRVPNEIEEAALVDGYGP